AGEPVTLDAVDTIADGLKPTRPGDLTFQHVNELVDDVVTVSDTAIREASALLFARSHLVVEFSGAATVAALLTGAWSGQAARTAAVLSGGNLDPTLVPSMLASLGTD
ncbi:MAG: pyridoxal-phosphate dependent enzyme, partial [Gemmatimonadota bacterium]